MGAPSGVREDFQQLPTAPASSAGLASPVTANTSSPSWTARSHQEWGLWREPGATLKIGSPSKGRPGLAAPRPPTAAQVRKDTSHAAGISGCSAGLRPVTLGPLRAPLWFLSQGLRGHRGIWSDPPVLPSPPVGTPSEQGAHSPQAALHTQPSRRT